MKTLSNAELQEAIKQANWLCRNNTGEERRASLEHFYNLLEEQRVRATQSVTLEPMEPAPGRVDFDARVRGQDGPEWLDVYVSGRLVPAHHIIDVIYVDGNEGTGTADSFDWSMMGQSNAIAKFRDWTAWEQSK